MFRKNIRQGTASSIGEASAHSNEYFYDTEKGIYYYSNGTSWSVTTFHEGRSVENYSSATASTAKLVMPANPDRKWLFFQNISNAHMHLGLGYIPTGLTGILIPKDVNASLQLEHFTVTGPIYVTCESAGKNYIALEG